jgi:hypothetical protein
MSIGVAAVVAALAAGCGGAGNGTTSGPSAGATTSSTPTTTVAPGCPNPEGGSANTCLGDLPAGTHETATFAPRITYTVPEGWSNQEDLAGNFLLLPPGSTLAGVNPETSDFLGVYSSVGAPVQCTANEAPDSSVASTPRAIVDWLRTQPAIIVSQATKVSIGGLTGLQVDLAFNDAKGGVACQDDLGTFALAFVGTGASSLAHGVSPGYALRVAFLTNGDTVLAIELADAKGGSDLADWWGAAAEVVDSLRFS